MCSFFSLVFSWFTLEQLVDLKAEGLWDELLDTFLPEIVIQDWYVTEHSPPSPCHESDSKTFEFDAA